MGAFGSALAGIGQGAGEFGEGVRNREHALHLQLATINAQKHERLKNQAEAYAKLYPDFGDEFRQLATAIESSNPLKSDFNQHAAKVNKVFADAQKFQADQQAAKFRKESIQRLTQGPSQEPKQDFTIGGVDVGQGGAVRQPLAQMIAQPPALQQPQPQPQAAPASLPSVNPTQGGGQGPAAAFPPPQSAPNNRAGFGTPGSTISATPPVPGNAALPAGIGAGAPPPHVQPISQNLNIPELEELIGPSMRALRKSGAVDPTIEELIKQRMPQFLGQEKLRSIQPILDELKPMREGELPDVLNLMRVQAELSALGIEGGAASNLLSPFIAASLAPPTRIPVDAGAMSPEEKSAVGLPPDATGKYTIMRDRFGKYLPPVAGWAGIGTYYDASGNVFTESKQSPGTVKGAVPPSQVAPIRGIGPGGEQQITTGAAAQQGRSPVDTGMAPPSMIGSQQTPSGGIVKVPPKLAPSSGPKQSSEPKVMTPKVRTILPPRVRPLDPANELDHKALIMAQDANAAKNLITNASDKFRVANRMAELGLEPGMITGSMRERANNARLIIQHLDQINGIINDAEKSGELGVVASRWNSFLTNKLGVDPTKGQVFARLSSELGFLTTAVAMAHGGLRGGSSPGMVEHWETALEAKDPATLKAKLGEAKSWMEGYAKLDRALDMKGMSTGTPTEPSVGATMIEVISPEGVSGSIPADKWPLAEKRGFKRKGK